jgi:hypothetical protein
MDRKGFRLRGEPDLVRQPSRTIVNQETMREIEATKTVPAPDNRFRAYAAPMADGRLVTDYRDRCVTRAPPGTQFSVKNWTVHNTDKIIDISRERQVQSTGQSLGLANTVPPPAVLQSCTTQRCSINPTDYPGGLGIERTDKAPPLFGTFTFPPDADTLARNKTFTALNKTIEYGRNTPTRWGHLYQ